LRALNLIVDQYLSFAEFQAQQRRPMHMGDWVSKLNDFLKLNERQILTDAGRVSHELGLETAHREFAKYEARQQQLEAQDAGSDFDRDVKRLTDQRQADDPAAKRRKKKIKDDPPGGAA
jgi:hypothetical protein